MTNPPNNNPLVTPSKVEDDPVRPWKAIIALLAPAVLAFLQSILDNGDTLPVWAWVLITGLVAAVGVFVVKNPKRLKRK